jgi:autotransporter-associated beta strand protein
MNRRVHFALMMTLCGSAMLVDSIPAWAVMTHRYSFTGNANDSVGTANWTVNGATFSGGQVVFDGVDDYLNLATNPLPASGAGSFEVWGTYAPTTPVGSRIMDFSSSNTFYLMLTPNSSSTLLTDTRLRWDNGFGIPLGPTGAPTTNTGVPVLLTAVIDPTVVDPVLGTGQLRLYQNGLLVASASAESLPILGDLASTNSNRLGHGTSTGPIPAAFLNGSIDEFRTYNTALTSAELLTSAVAGPDTPTVTFTDNTWNVAGPNDWNSGGNWSATSVPVLANRAVIGNGGTAVVSAAVPQAGTLRITSGALTVGTGGTLDAKFPIQLSPGAAGTATINVNNGGRLAISGILSDTAAGAKTINIDNGTIAAGFASALVNVGATANIGAGGATLDTGAGTMQWDAALAGSGKITKTGTGRLNLRPVAINLAPYDQNPNFTGEFHVDGGTVDVQREHGVFGRGGSTHGGDLHLNNSTLIINTAYPTAPGYRKEFPSDVTITGQNQVVNLVDRVATEIIMSGSIRGSGTVEFTKPNLPTDPNNDNDISDSAEGLDFQNRANPDTTDLENPTLFVDNSTFTGRIIATGDWAIRIRAETADFPNAIVELNNTRAWMGKRGTDSNQIIELGGVAGAADVPNLRWPRLVASIAASGTLTDVTMEDFNDVTYMLGGASEDAVFDGRIEDNVGTGFVDKVSVVKRGDNAQTIGGPSTYGGTTTVNGGTLLINGRHSRDALQLAGGGEPLANALPVGDYTVNTGGTLGGTGAIGSVADPVDILVAGGTIAPGASVGTLSNVGNMAFGANSHLAIEVEGATADKLAVTGNIDLSALANSLDVTGTGSGSWVIATYTGTLTGVFESITNGLTIDYGTRNNGQITISGTLSAGVPGDYNGDQKVDAADYTVWRDNLGGAATALQNRDPANSGNVNADDYTFWKSRFGTSGSGSASIGGNVPEPSTITMLCVMLASVASLTRRRG